MWWTWIITKACLIRNEIRSYYIKYYTAATFPSDWPATVAYESSSTGTVVVAGVIIIIIIKLDSNSWNWIKTLHKYILLICWLAASYVSSATLSLHQFAWCYNKNISAYFGCSWRSPASCVTIVRIFVLSTSATWWRFLWTFTDALVNADTVWRKTPRTVTTRHEICLCRLVLCILQLFPARNDHIRHVTQLRIKKYTCIAN